MGHRAKPSILASPTCSGIVATTGMFRVFRRKNGRYSLQSRLRGGEGGIRTLGTGVSPYNGLANRRIRPLCHLSGVRSFILPRHVRALSRGLRGNRPCHELPSLVAFELVVVLASAAPQFELNASVKDIIFIAPLICSSVAEDFRCNVTGSAGSRSK